MSSKFTRLLPLLAIAGLLAGCGMGSKSNSGTNTTMAPPAGTVEAMVNGEPLTSRELDAYINLRTRGANVNLSPQERRSIAKELVQVLLAAQAAKKADLENKPDVQTGLALQRQLYLANAAVENYTSTHSPSEAQMKSEYEQMVKAQSGEEYKARHILVKTKAEAEKIIDQLNKGADFATLAKKDSIGPSAKQGGELGWFKANDMVPAFSAALPKLKPGEYTKEPVHTQYGWHVILLEKERTAAPPAYSAMKPMLARQAQGHMVQGYLSQLESQAKVEWKVPLPSTAPKAASAAAPKAGSAASAASPATGG